jgi:hypothetical protein
MQENQSIQQATSENYNNVEKRKIADSKKECAMLYFQSVYLSYEISSGVIQSSIRRSK